MFLNIFESFGLFVCVASGFRIIRRISKMVQRLIQNQALTAATAHFWASQEFKEDQTPHPDIQEGFGFRVQGLEFNVRDISVYGDRDQPRGRRD